MYAQIDFPVDELDEAIVGRRQCLQSEQSKRRDSIRRELGIASFGRFIEGVANRLSVLHVEYDVRNNNGLVLYRTNDGDPRLEPGIISVCVTDTLIPSVVIRCGEEKCVINSVGELDRLFTQTSPADNVLNSIFQLKGSSR
jgi:hypothetical protein